MSELVTLHIEPKPKHVAAKAIVLTIRSEFFDAFRFCRSIFRGMVNGGAGRVLDTITSSYQKKFELRVAWSRNAFDVEHKRVS